MIRTLLVGLSLCFCLQTLYAQEKFDPDEVFKQARTLGFDGKREEARQLCRKILDQYPDYSDVRIFMGRLYSWDGQYDDARRTLSDVVAKSPELIDARSALIDVELFSGNPEKALELSQTGLLAAPADETLLYKKAQALNKLNKPREAANILERILDRNPSHGDARALQKTLAEGQRPYRFSADYGYQHLTALDGWHDSSVSLSRETPAGSVIGRFNYANRFSTNAYQMEVDAYPRLRRGLYMYVNYGYSPTDIFPKHRAGAELYANPGKGLEFSLGSRYLHFSSDVWIYTATVGKYFGNYFVNFRPFVTPGTAGTSVSGTAMLRRYFGDSDTYVGLSVGGGSSPDDAISTADLARLNSFRISGSGSIAVGNGSYLKFSGGWDTEQLSTSADRTRISFSTGFTKRF